MSSVERDVARTARAAETSAAAPGGESCAASNAHPIPGSPCGRLTVTQMCELLVACPDVVVLGVEDIGDGLR